MHASAWRMGASKASGIRICHRQDEQSSISGTLCVELGCNLDRRVVGRCEGEGANIILYRADVAALTPVECAHASPPAFAFPSLPPSTRSPSRGSDHVTASGQQSQHNAMFQKQGTCLKRLEEWDHDRNAVKGRRRGGSG